MIKGVALLRLWLKSVYGRTVSEAHGCLSNTAMPVKTLMSLRLSSNSIYPVPRSLRVVLPHHVKLLSVKVQEGHFCCGSPAAAALCRPFPEKAAHSPFPLYNI